MWPTEFALTELTADVEARIGALVERAMGEGSADNSSLAASVRRVARYPFYNRGEPPFTAGAGASGDSAATLAPARGRHTLRHRGFGGTIFGAYDIACRIQDRRVWQLEDQGWTRRPEKRLE